MDEWHRSAARFSSQWGWLAGGGLVAVLLALPPIQSLIVSSAATWSQSPDPDQKLVLLTFTLGLMAVVATQAVSTLLLSLGWRFWMSRNDRDPS